MRLFDLSPFANFGTTLRQLLDDATFRAAFTMLASIVAVATLFYWIVEGWSPLDSLYFAVIAAATVGFGDFAPQTDVGKLFTIVYVLASVGLLVFILSRIAAGMVDRRIDRLEAQPSQERTRRVRRGRGSGAREAARTADEGDGAD